VNNNKGQQEKQVATLCPFLNEECIQEKCALWTEIVGMKPGLSTPQKQGVCVFTALCMITSTPKLQPTPGAMRMPPGFPSIRG